MTCKRGVHERRNAATPIQLGENWWGLPDMANSVAAGASDLAMPDAMKIGGVTGWQRAAALAAAARGLPVSPHIFVEFSAHLMAVTPTAHWLEYLEKAGAVLQQPLRIENGDALPLEGHGAGLEWDEAAVARYAA